MTDVDYPDMPIGGWIGAIFEIQKNGLYMVLWSRETLDAIHPVFKKRCENGGLELARYWLAENDLESDEGGGLEIERPKEITTETLSHEDQDERIRMVFGAKLSAQTMQANECQWS